MNLSEMLHKNSPTGSNRSASLSDYEKLVERNTELVDELKDKNKEIEKLKELTDKYEKEHNEEFKKWEEDIKRWTKALHRIQLIQMAGEVSMKDISELARIVVKKEKIESESKN